MAFDPADDQASDPAPLPSDGVRTVVSLLLFVHLFCLAVVMFSNPPASPLAQGLGRFARPYLRALAMDLSYRFHLTHADELDVDYTIEAELKDADDNPILGLDGSPVTESFPTADIGPGIRYRRYGLLAWHVAQRAQFAEETGDDSAAGVLPQAIAASLFDQTGATQGLIRCKGHRLQDRADVQSEDPVRANPNSPDFFYVKYPASVWLSGGQVRLQKEAPASESAPAVVPAETAPAKAPPDSTPGEDEPLLRPPLSIP